MKILLNIACVCAFALTGLSDTILYVKPGGIGEGTSWSDATDFVTGAATAKAGTGACSIYVAKGNYLITSQVAVPPGTSVYGGFAGDDMSETPEGRNLEADGSGAVSVPVRIYDADPE